MPIIQGRFAVYVIPRLELPDKLSRALAHRIYMTVTRPEEDGIAPDHRSGLIVIILIIHVLAFCVEDPVYAAIPTLQVPS